jgi:predicted pyridoxine 5'-phosphate oxidase superfamily flavin-nucleotide-binding protein
MHDRNPKGAVMETRRFDRVIETEADLRGIIPPPADLVVKKQLPALDEHARRFIERSPFVVIGTCGRSRGCDVSPRGEAPGGFLVLDERTAGAIRSETSWRIHRSGSSSSSPAWRKPCG